MFQHECNSPLNTPGQVDGISEYSKKYSATWRVLGSTDSWNKLSEREREREVKILLKCHLGSCSRLETYQSL